MSTLREAARLVVAAWSSTRPAWIEQCNAAVMALDAALKAQAEQACKCNLRTRLVGDGCEVCNPKLAAELAQQVQEPAQEPVAAVAKNATDQFDHAIGADRFKVVRGAFWWHVLIGDSTKEHGKFRSRAGAERMAADLLREFRNGAFVQHTAPPALRAVLAEPDIDPVDEYRKGFIDGQIDMRDRPEEQPEPAQEPVASRLKMHSHEVPTTMRTELHSWEKAVLGPPHPGDFGIPKEHWEAAQHYANYWNENRAKAQPEPAQEPVAWATEIIDALQAQYDTEMIKENDSGDALIRLDDAIAAVEDAEKHYTAPPKSEPAQEPVAWMVYTEDGKSVCVTDNPADFADEHRALPLYTAPPQRPPLTDEEIDKAVAQERDALLDHIYEYGTLAEGVLERIRRLARAVERFIQSQKGE